MNWKGASAQRAEEIGQRLDILAVDFDELQAAADPRQRAMHGFDQRGLAHAARAPEQRIVGRKPAGEALGVGEENVALEIDAFKQAQIDAIDLCDRMKHRPGRAPDEGFGGRKSGFSGSRGARRSSASAIRARLSAISFFDMRLECSLTIKADFRA